MTPLFRSTLTGVWPMLSIMTIASWWTGSRGDGHAYTLVTAGVLLFALHRDGWRWAAPAAQRSR